MLITVVEIRCPVGARNGSLENLVITVHAWVYKKNKTTNYLAVAKSLVIKTRWFSGFSVSSVIGD